MGRVKPKHLVAYIVAAGLVLGVSFVMGRMNGLVFGGMFGGQVLNQETGKPVEGAYVIATWEDYTLSQTSCVHMDIQVTDSEGKYLFGPWIDILGRVVFRQNAPRRMVYAPGYEKVNYGNPIYIRRHHDTPKERITKLRWLSSHFCGATKEIPQMADRVRKRIYLEARHELDNVSADPDGDYAYRVEVLRRICGSACRRLP
jgi:hypothetical protein